MNVDDLTVGQLREIRGLIRRRAATPFPWKVGDAVLIRSVTHYYTGKITGIGSDWIGLSDAAWIADTGRFSEALTSGALSEIEPYVGPVTVGRGGIVDITAWPHPLPRSKK